MNKPLTNIEKDRVKVLLLSFLIVICPRIDWYSFQIFKLQHPLSKLQIKGVFSGEKVFQ